MKTIECNPRFNKTTSKFKVYDAGRSKKDSKECDSNAPNPPIIRLINEAKLCNTKRDGKSYPMSNDLDLIF
ncbi:MAG: hypothetical protein H0X50_09180 [Nitrosopumilus sp.]|jgi:hypothetical protein|nr:hypothetical protein [Nitrosopumilus sp.]